MVRYHQAQDGVPEYPIMQGYKMACCDCGLVHDVDFRVIRRVNVHQDGTYEVEPVDDPALGVELNVKRNNRSTSFLRRKQLVREYDGLYQFLNKENMSCHYCGSKATSVDHVPALFLVGKHGPDHYKSAGFVKVRACSHCNAMLGNLDRKMPDRFEYLALRLGDLYREMVKVGEPNTDKKLKMLRRIQIIQSRRKIYD